MMRRLWGAIWLGIFLAGAGELPAIPGYPIPSQFVVRIKQNPDKATGELAFEAVIKVWAGTITKGQIVFASSQDLEVTSPPIVVDGIKSGKEKRLPFFARKKTGSKPVSRTWVRLKMTYDRDLKALQKLANNEKDYPQPYWRALLIRQIGKLSNQDSQVAEYFFPLPKMSKSTKEIRK